MAAGYWAAGKQNDVATFDLFVRRLPPQREYLVAAGLAQALAYLQEARFTAEEIAWLRQLPVFAHTPPEFFTYLANWRFTGTVRALAEGTVAFAGEPLLTVQGPLIEAQLVETHLLATISFQTMIASKSARLVQLAAGRQVIEFGTRRAHSPSAGLYAARAAYLAGCQGTSNVLAGQRFGIPLYGTSAHAWVLSFTSETEAFRHLQGLLGERAVQLIDTYDTAEGARAAAALGKPLAAVRIDSGDPIALSREVRAILDAAGLHETRIMVTGDLDEESIAAIVAAEAPVDSFGVGTHLVTSADAPALSAVYKLVQYETQGLVRYPAKRSPGKATLAGAKQVYRQAHADLLATPEELAAGEPLLTTVMANGEVLANPSLTEARERCARQPRYPRTIEVSEKLRAHRIS
ncbi:MAG: nicotinate phosphoribosyltransferase [Bryobacteraceae bacterium]|nr:nicotinate phosphoribosyltransferase [Bryobacteraceae bacterium]